MAARTVISKSKPRQKPRKPTEGAFAISGSAASERARAVRTRFGVTRKVFSRLTGYSERAIAGWEGGKEISESAVRRLTELDRLFSRLSEVIKAEFIPRWLEIPNDAFNHLSPLEVIERGEMDRIWQAVYYLESGTPY